MREPVTFETRLAAAFERYADGAPVDVEPIEVARLAMYGDTRPRSAVRWLDLRTPAWRSPRCSHCCCLRSSQRYSSGAH